MSVNRPRMAASASDLRRAAACINVEDLRRLARQRVPRGVFDFIDGGSGDERSLQANTAAFANWALVPRVARNVMDRSPATSILGAASALPLVLGPTGLAGFFHPGGEMALANAAAAAGIPFCLSANSIASVEEIAPSSGAVDRWFQIYFLKDRDWMNGLVRRAHTAGYRVLCITVDLPLTGRRERDTRNAFTMPMRPTLKSVLSYAGRPAWVWGIARGRPMRFGNFVAAGGGGFVDVAQHVASLFDPSADWDDVARLRDLWPGPVVVKGVMHPEDALRAHALGADAVVVSNHGGRQLNSAPSTLSALSEVAAAVGGRMEVLVDGGVRRGTDVLKALALGARACMIGRPAAWGLAAAGQAGVAQAIGIFAAELDNAMALLGVRQADEVTRDYLRPAG